VRNNFTLKLESKTFTTSLISTWRNQGYKKTRPVAAKYDTS